MKYPNGKICVTCEFLIYVGKRTKIPYCTKRRSPTLHLNWCDEYVSSILFVEEDMINSMNAHWTAMRG